MTSNQLFCEIQKMGRIWELNDIFTNRPNILPKGYSYIEYCEVMKRRGTTPLQESELERE